MPNFLFERSLEKFLASNLLQRLQKFAHILQSAAQKFQDDACVIRSNAIAYSIIFSIIPLLTIFVQAAKINRGVIKTHIASFLAANGLADTSDLMVILDEIMARAETIAGIGFIFVLYSASNFFRHLEEAFGYIYRVPRQRPLLYRFALYIAAFVVLPIITIFTGQIVQSIRYNFERPTLSAIMLRAPSANNKNAPYASHKWVSTSHGTIYVYNAKNKKIRTIDLTQKISASAPYPEYIIDLKSGRSGRSWEVLETPARNYQLDTPERFNLIDCFQYGNTIYAISEGGTVYYTRDEGQSWQFQQLIFNADNNLYPPRVRDVHITNQGHILFLIDETSYSILAIRENTRRWRHYKLNANYRHIFAINNIDNTVNTLQKKEFFRFRNGLYLTGKGKLLYSADQGRNWQGPYTENFGERKVIISTMQADRRGNIYFGGQNGAFWLHTPQQERLYPDVYSRQDILGLDIQNDGQGILYGKKGLLRYTNDSGRTWQLPQNTAALAELDIRAYARDLDLADGALYLAGNNDMLLHTIINKAQNETAGSTFGNNNPGLLRDAHGRHLVSLKVMYLSATPTWQSLLLTAFIEPLLIVIIFIVLSLLYIMVPNTYVAWRAAIAGAAFSSISITIFLSFFRGWLGASTTTGYIYGAWAAIPLGMLIVLVSAYIVLFGLEIAFVLQNPFLYRLPAPQQDKKDYAFWNCLVLLCLCYYSLQEKKRPLTNQTAQHYFGKNARHLRSCRELLIDTELIYYEPLNGEYLPLEAANALCISDLRRRLAQRLLRIPSKLARAELQKPLADFMQTPQLHDSNASSKLTIAEILPTFFEKDMPLSANKR